MNTQMICFFILGVGPLLSLVTALIVDIVIKNKKRK